jgi:tetraacyldisaccharide 4'-kinase
MMRQYVLAIMNGRRKDPVSLVVAFLLYLVSRAYGMAVRCRHFFYRVGFLKRHTVPVPVISVGNITLGGTGKTPFTITLARRLGREKKVAVLVRGYGEDEWKMLGEKCAPFGVKVFVGRDRVVQARRALDDGAELLILDDGFQHVRLRRDLDIVLLNAADPFGNGHLFPRGTLREGVESLKDADIICLTKIDRHADLPALENRVRAVAPAKPLIKATHTPKCLRDVVTGREEALAVLARKRVTILSAICDPAYFGHTVERTGAHIAGRYVFGDHYLYRQSDIDRIVRESRNGGTGMIVTTEKDAVKLKNLSLPTGDVRIMALCIELEITDGEDLDARLSMLCPGTIL